ncbi:MAG TPA: hypothetical protein VFK57_19635 [Vicinamibacterales bacterium]|nr:hypothetical protein [Vicinamibacterales bacterium]
MFSTGRFRRALAVVSMLSCSLSVSAQTAPADVSLYRIFLNDGTTLLSYGEFARVADRVVVSLPLDAAPPSSDPASLVAGPPLHLLSIPAETVDWEKTDAYADSVRATRYAATRGPDDFALLNEAVSRSLNEIALTADPARKVAMAAEARQNVTKWAADHFGYRAERVAELAGLFDSVIAETRAQGGAVNVDLSLVANMAAPPSVPLLPPPSFEDHIDQALRAAALSPEASERISLLRSIERVLVEAGVGRSAATVPLYARARSALVAEERASRAYEALTRDAMQAADRYARAADVTGVERIIRRALSEDDRLGQRRPQEMAALLATLDTKLDAARRLRLARDNWALRADALRTYRAAVARPLSLLRVSRDSLDQIKRLAGPSYTVLQRLNARMSEAARLMAAIGAPAEAAAAHAIVKSAVQFAARAGELRLRAVATREMLPANEASSAAAGALMFFERANEELAALAALPALPPAGPR